MGNRRKPVGAAWEDFKQKWAASDHEHKLYMCADFGVTYDTARHWIAQGDTSSAVQEAAIATEDEPTEALEAIMDTMAIPTRTMLDFVSFDLETTNLTADFSIIMCACIKPFGQDAIVFRGDSYPTWRENRSNDQPIVVDITNELSKHAVVLTHYGTNFDIRYLRGKLARYGLPNLPPMFGVDTYQVAKQNFKVSRRRLETLGEYFQLGEKSGVKGNLWLDASLNGNSRALDAIVAHCIVDVELLEKLGALSFPYMRSIKRL